MSIRTIGIALITLAAVGACQRYNEPVTELSSSFGDSVRHNMAMQIINPEGSTKSGPTGLEGHRAAEAIKRYQKAQEKQLEEISAK